MSSLTTISRRKRREKTTDFLAPMTASGFCFTRSREVAKKKRAAGERQNRCVSRTLTINNQPSTTYFIYDGWQLAEELNSSGTEQALYVNGANVDEILYKAASANTVFYQHDALGNTTALSDANGDLVEHYTYDVFGKPSIFDASNNPLTASVYGNRFLFTGREYLQEVGLYDYRNRVYSADLGRFLQTDPLRFAAGDVNVYRYCGNDGVNYGDAFGLYWNHGPHFPKQTLNWIEKNCKQINAWAKEMGIDPLLLANSLAEENADNNLGTLKSDVNDIGHAFNLAMGESGINMGGIMGDNGDMGPANVNLTTAQDVTGGVLSNSEMAQLLASNSGTVFVAAMIQSQDNKMVAAFIKNASLNEQIALQTNAYRQGPANWLINNYHPDQHYSNPNYIPSSGNNRNDLNSRLQELKNILKNCCKNKD